MQGTVRRDSAAFRRQELACRHRPLLLSAVIGCLALLPSVAAAALLVVDYESGRILGYDENTGKKTSWAAEVGGSPSGIAVAADGTVFTTSLGNSWVARYTPGSNVGQIFAATFLSGISGPYAITVGQGDDLFVTGLGSDNVGRFDGTTGAFEGLFVPGAGGGLQDPTGLTFGPGGDLFVASSATDQVLRFDGTTGAFEGVFAEGGGLDNPEGIAFGPDGDLFVVSLWTNSVLRFDGGTGAFEGVFAQGGGLNLPRDLVFDSSLFVSSSGDGRVLRYDGVTGAFQDVFAKLPGNASPFGLAFGPDLGPLPEPGSLLLLGLGLACLGATQRQGRRRKAN